MEQHLTHIVQVNLTSGKDTFKPFVTSLTAKTKNEGHDGLIGYNVYFDDEAEVAVFVITYKNAQAFLDHHDIIGSWQEIQQGTQISQVTGMSFLGPRSAALDEWISSRPFPFKVGKFATHAAGFHRLD